MGRDSRGTILIVDDDPQALQSVSVLLHAHGFAVRSCADGVSALVEFSKTQPDVVVADINMPTMNGFRLTEKIHEMDRETPIILITADTDEEVRQSALKSRAFDFIVKPIPPSLLVTAVTDGIEYVRALKSEKIPGWSGISGVEGASGDGGCVNESIVDRAADNGGEMGTGINRGDRGPEGGDLAN